MTEVRQTVGVVDGGRYVESLHAVMGDAELRCWGGHLFPGSRIFAAEAHVQELKGDSRIRTQDIDTGLALWCPA